MIRNLKLLFSNRQARSAGFVFALNSLMFGSWITHLPEIKAKLQITDGELGLALLGVPLGSIVAMPFMGWVIHRLGSGRTTLVYGIAFCVISTFPVMAPDYLLFFVSLALVGMSTGSMDIAMNAAAAAVEKDAGINIMSGCHGMWSLGGMIGAGTTSLMAGFAVNPVLHILPLAALLLLFILLLSKALLSIRDTASGKAFILSLPAGPLVGIALIGFCVMMGEGAVYDWSAIYLKDTLLADAFYSGLGYAGFSLTMTAGRFYGDEIIHRWGARKTVMTGAAVSLAGVLLAVLWPHPLMAITGFTVAGAGFSCLIPSIYISASRMPGGSPGANLAAVASLGYFGLLAGPPLIGMVAEHLGLGYGLGLVVVLMSIVAIGSWKIRFG